LDRIGRVDRAFLETHTVGWENLLERARSWTLERAARLARVEAKGIAEIAEGFASADPALVRCGWGLERNRNSESSVAAVIVLPATTFLEHTELSTSYGTYAVMLAEPVIEPQGESKPNEEVFGLIMQAMGIEDRAPRGEALVREALASIGGPVAPGGAGAERADGRGRLERLRRDGLLTFDFPGPRPVQFATVFPKTPGRKADLWPAALGTDPYVILDDPADGRHPLALISPATDKTISSTLGEFNHDDVRLEMHPEDAAPRRL